MTNIPAEPYAFEYDLRTCAPIIIDMQRDFVEPGGFGTALDNDVSLLRCAIDPIRGVLAAARRSRMLVVHTREAEVCVRTTVREANDRGYDCLVLEDCVATHA